MIPFSPTPEAQLVIPCYRESARLPGFLPKLCSCLDAYAQRVTLQVVDDGSPGTEPASLRRIVDEARARHRFIAPLLACPRNGGKGHAIRACWDAAPAGIAWLGFVDADGAVPAEDVARVLDIVLRRSTPCIVAAVRDNQLGAVVERHPLRHLGSRLFQAWVRCCHHLPLKDTQCGLKFIPHELYDRRRGRWSQDRYAFDLELLLAARALGFAIESVPVAWREQAVSRLHLPAAIRLFWQAGRLAGRRDW